MCRNSVSLFLLAVLYVVSLGVDAEERVFHALNATSGNSTAAPTCAARNLYAAATLACGANVLCPITCVPFTCACLLQYRECVEMRSTIASVRTTCSAAAAVHNELVAIAAGIPFASSGLGESCRNIACQRGVLCGCTAPGISLTAAPTTGIRPPPAPAPETPAPTGASGNGSNSSRTPAPSGRLRVVVSVTVAGVLEFFNVRFFVERVAAAMAISQAQVVVVSVTDGSVLVKFFFIDGASTSSATLADRFVSQVSATTNSFTQAFTVISVGAAIEDVALATPLPPLTAAPTPRPTTAGNGTAPPRDDQATDGGGVTKLTVIIIIVVVGVVVIVMMAVGGFCFYWFWRRNSAAPQRKLRVARAASPISGFNNEPVELEHYSA